MLIVVDSCGSCTFPWNGLGDILMKKGLGGSNIGYERDVNEYEVEMVLIYYYALCYYRIGCDVVFCDIKKEMMSQCIVSGNR